MRHVCNIPSQCHSSQALFPKTEAISTKDIPKRCKIEQGFPASAHAQWPASAAPRHQPTPNAVAAASAPNKNKASRGACDTRDWGGRSQSARSTAQLHCGAAANTPLKGTMASSGRGRRVAISILLIRNVKLTIYSSRLNGGKVGSTAFSMGQAIVYSRVAAETGSEARHRQKKAKPGVHDRKLIWAGRRRCGRPRRGACGARPAVPSSWARGSPTRACPRPRCGPSPSPSACRAGCAPG